MQKEGNFGHRHPLQPTRPAKPSLPHATPYPCWHIGTMPGTDCAIITSHPAHFQHSLLQQFSSYYHRAKSDNFATMFRTGARRLATSARQLAATAQTAAQMEAPNQYGIRVSKAQGVVKGLVGGKLRAFSFLLWDCGGQ